MGRIIERYVLNTNQPSFSTHTLPDTFGGSSICTDIFSFELFVKNYYKSHHKVFRFHNMVLCRCFIRETSSYQVHVISFFLAIDIRNRISYHHESMQGLHYREWEKFMIISSRVDQLSLSFAHKNTSTWNNLYSLSQKFIQTVFIVQGVNF